MLPGAQEAHERQLSGFLSVGLALGDTRRTFTSDFIHSCLQFHPQSSRPRHAGWTSLFLHHHLTPSSSDSFSPSLHGVSPLQSQTYSCLGQGRTLPLAKPGLPVPGSPASPLSSGNHPAFESPLSEMRMLPPSLSPHRHPSGHAPHRVLARHGASSQWWGCSGLCASVGL